MTISYEVTIRLDDPSLANAFEQYMTSKHVPEVFATGCFLDGRFEKAASGVYRSRYTAASQEELDRYLRDFAEAMRADFRTHFPAGVTLSRETWTALAHLQ